MEALMKAINDIIKDKDATISLQKWEIERLKEKIEELKNDIENIRKTR